MLYFVFSNRQPSPPYWSNCDLGFSLFLVPCFYFLYRACFCCAGCDDHQARRWTNNCRRRLSRATGTLTPSSTSECYHLGYSLFRSFRRPAVCVSVKGCFFLSGTCISRVKSRLRQDDPDRARCSMFLEFVFEVLFSSSCAGFPIYDRSSPCLTTFAQGVIVVVRHDDGIGVVLIFFFPSFTA